MKKRGRILFGVGVAATSLLLAGACREKETIEPKQIVSYPVERRDIVEYRRESGFLKSFRTFPIVPVGESDQLEAVFVREGDFVEKGTSLFRFDTSLVTRTIDLLNTRIEAAQLRLQSLKDRRRDVDVTSARQKLMEAEQGHREALKGLELQEQLTAKGLSSPRALEEIKARVGALGLGVDLARARLAELQKEKTSPSISELTVRIKELESELQLRREKKKKSEDAAVAPFDGRVLWIEEAVKNLLSPSGEVSVSFPVNREPLMIIADTAVIRVHGQFFESDIASIRVGQEALVRAEHVPGEVFSGTVGNIGQFGRRRGQTSTVLVEVIVDNGDNLLKPGLTAEIEIKVAERESAVVVPTEYLRYAGTTSRVHRLNADGTAAVVDVVTGISDGRFVEILSGLAERDQIVME